jgi:hypothetical protein
MSPENPENDRLKNDDEIIGKFLSMKVNKSKVETKCPSPEDLASFIDGTLEKKLRDSIMGHISSCNECYEVFSDTIKIQGEISNIECHEVPPDTLEVQDELPKESWVNTLIFKFMPYPVAVAAAILVMLFVFRGNVSNELSFVKDRVAALIEDIDKGSIPPLYEDSSAYSLGFADTSTPERTAFKIGIYLTDLEVVMTAGDKERTLWHIGEIISLSKSIKKDDDKTGRFFDGLWEENKSGIPLRRIAGRIDPKIITDDDSLLYILLFGKWCEGGRIAAISRKREFYKAGDVRTFINGLDDSSLPDGVLESLENIEEIMGKEVFTEKQYNKLEKEFDGLISLF